MDLSPSLVGSAIDSLNSDEKETFSLALKRVGEYSFLRNKLKNLEKSSLTYNKIKRLILKRDIGKYQSTQDLLTAFAEGLYLSSCDYSYTEDNSSLSGFIKSF